ncbi:MAG: hypothetical protein HMLKMBBP_01756 [Planctomycetes bacterium]|nr:hypothetical protein [Planctomycetota bacterium]
MKRHGTHGISAVALAAFAALCAAYAPGARAQDHGPDPQDIERKILEIERLMKQAEESLAKASGAKSETAEDTARRIEKLLDEKARQSAGKSAEELRKEASGGSKEATEALKRLMEEAKSESSKSGEGIKRLLEETKSGGKGATDGIQWLLEQAQRGGTGGSGQGQQQQKPEGGQDPKDPVREKQKPDSEPKPKDGKESEEKPKDPKAELPESRREKPRTEEMQKWLAELPPQVRKAYETEDWDSVPPKWRDLLREWTKKMADDLERERR